MKVSSYLKYNSIMNTNNLSQSCEKLGPSITKQLMELECVVTEKIHGENFRVGIDTSGRLFIGQRNVIFYLDGDIQPSETVASFNSEHPHWNRMNTAAQQLVNKLLIFCSDKYEETGNSFVFFGELCGNGMQSGFKYPWDGLKVLYFDVQISPKDGVPYYLPHRDAYYWMDLNGVPRVPVVATKRTVAEALKIDVERMVSEVAISDFIEGVVIKPIDRELVNTLWPFDNRFIIKHKTKRHSEQKQRDKTKSVPNLNSPFCDFVTFARIEHAIERINEQGNITINYEMSDLRYIRNEVLVDIQNEENNGLELPIDDVKSLNKYIPKVYSDFLTLRVSELLGID